MRILQPMLKITPEDRQKNTDTRRNCQVKDVMKEREESKAPLCTKNG